MASRKKRVGKYPETWSAVKRLPGRKQITGNITTTNGERYAREKEGWRKRTPAEIRRRKSGRKARHVAKNVSKQKRNASKNVKRKVTPKRKGRNAVVANRKRGRIRTTRNSVRKARKKK